MNIPTLKTIFRFPFQGKDWQTRFLIGVVLVFVSFIIPIIPLIFVSGYILEVMRRAAKGEGLVLPEWSDWGKLGLNGLKSTLISLIFLLPGSIILIGGWAFYMAFAFSMPFITAGSTNGRNADAIFVPLFLFAFSIFFISLFVGPILLALGGIPLPAATANMASEGKLAAGFRIRQWWPALWKNKLGYFIAFTIFLGLISILYFATTMIFMTLVCCWLIPLLSVPAGFYLALVYAALFGVTFRQSIESEPASQPTEGEAAPLDDAAPAEETPAPAVEETPASQPVEAPETPAEEAPAVEDSDIPKSAPSTRRKKTPPTSETPA
jgi:hypothetical protein